LKVLVEFGAEKEAWVRVRAKVREDGW